ncbi:MAG: hypothetical protein IJ262_07620 [Clostridia bacterium]|nr:hypothetical protein [Clostridia bacterium]
MTDDKILFSHARDLKNRCESNSMITSTSFLDLRQRSLLSALEKENNKSVLTFYFGGYSEAERVVAVFVPSFYETYENIEEYFSENREDNPLSLIRIDKDRFSTLSHRDYLGSLMGLGLKREVLGDIIADDEGCFLVCLKSSKSFICNNLKTVGRGSVTVKEVSFDRIKEKKENFDEINSFISSERLDNVVAAAFSLSRSKSVEAIEKGLVFVNSAENLKPDFRLNEGDKVVYRGKGKIVFSKITGQSKKGRLHVLIKKYK